MNAYKHMQELYDNNFNESDKWTRILFIVFFLENLLKVETNEEFILESWTEYFNKTYKINKHKSQQVFTSLPSDLRMKVYVNLERKLALQQKKRSPIKEEYLKRIEHDFCYKRLVKSLFVG